MLELVRLFQPACLYKLQVRQPYRECVYSIQTCRSRSAMVKRKIWSKRLTPSETSLLRDLRVLCVSASWFSRALAIF